ncbi:UNVERIFIED_CONTAM: hypothetical protein FKN15_029176 [Acipenser sinensis]
MKCLREKGQGPRIDQYFLRSQSSQSNEIQRQEANHSSQDISTPVIDVRRTCMDTVSDEPNDPCEPEYFSQHLGEYDNVLGALEDLNISILKAMDKTKKDYQEASHLEQFVTRFLLKETANQLQSLQSSLECAMETTAEQTRQERQVSQLYWQEGFRTVYPGQGPVKPEVLSIQWSGKRSNRRLQRNNSLSPNNPHFNIVNSGLHDEDNQWIYQINRLQKLIDRLEKKVHSLTCTGTQDIDKTRTSDKKNI